MKERAGDRSSTLSSGKPSCLLSARLGSLHGSKKVHGGAQRNPLKACPRSYRHNENLADVPKRCPRSSASGRWACSRRVHDCACLLALDSVVQLVETVDGFIFDDCICCCSSASALLISTVVREMRKGDQKSVFAESDPRKSMEALSREKYEQTRYEQTLTYCHHRQRHQVVADN